MRTSTPLAEHTIIVTGGAGLLGREYGRALTEAGANVVLADIDGAGAAAAAERASADHSKAIGLDVDVADPSSVEELVRTTLQRFGRVDGLVNNAAINPSVGQEGRAHLTQTFEHFPLDDWNRAMAVNVTGMFLCAQAVSQTMLAQGSGAIVNVSSTYGIVGPDQRLYESDSPEKPRGYKPVTYTVTKSAVIGLTKYLAAYWAGTGIRVNTLSPGGVFDDQPDEFVRRYSARTPLGRMARRDEYCGALVFLLSESASYMTGSNLVVDGGWTAW